MEDLVQEGKTRFVGVSNFKAAEIEACMQTRQVDVGQYGYHLFDRRLEREVFPTHARHGIGLMGYGSLAHGLLTGTFDDNTTFESPDWRSRGVAFNMPLFTKENFPRNLRAVADLQEIATHMGIENLPSRPGVGLVEPRAQRRPGGCPQRWRGRRQYGGPGRGILRGGFTSDRYGLCATQH